MADKRVTDLNSITTAPTSGVMHFVDVTNQTQNAAGSSFKVTKADLLKESTAAILLNTAKVGISAAQSNAITANTAKVGYTDNLVAASPSVSANTAKVGYTEDLVNANANVTANTAKTGITASQSSAIILNTAKTGITAGQSSAIIINTAKVGYTEVLVSANSSVAANTEKVGITTTQAAAITANTAKIGITTGQTNAIIANTAKVGYTEAAVTANVSVVANTAKVGITTIQATAITNSAPLSSPDFTGTPTAPTATVGTNTAQLATTAFVLANGGSTTKATSAASGTVRTDVTEAEPIVYTKATVDSSFMTITTDQSISSVKTFTNQISANGLNFGTQNQFTSHRISRSGNIIAYNATGGGSAHIWNRGDSSGAGVEIMRIIGDQLAIKTNTDNGVDKLNVAGSGVFTTTKTSGFTVATLPSPPAQGTGARAFVTDALNPTFLGTLTGGGTVRCPAFYNGTNWVAA